MERKGEGEMEVTDEGKWRKRRMKKKAKMKSSG